MRAYFFCLIIACPCYSNANASGFSISYSGFGQYWASTSTDSNKYQLNQLRDSTSFQSIVLGMRPGTDLLIDNEFLKKNFNIWLALRFEEYRSNQLTIRKTLHNAYPIPIAGEIGLEYEIHPQFTTGLLAYVYDLEVYNNSVSTFFKDSNLEIIIPITFRIPISKQIFIGATYRISTDFSIDANRLFEQQNTVHINLDYFFN